MKAKFKKLKTEHHIIEEFTKLLLDIEKIPMIQKIIPWIISRQQKNTSEARFRISYSTQTWINCIMSKWATAQKIYIICNPENKEDIKKEIKNIIKNHKEITYTFKSLKKINNSKKTLDNENYDENNSKHNH